VEVAKYIHTSTRGHTLLYKFIRRRRRYSSFAQVYILRRSVDIYRMSRSSVLYGSKFPEGHVTTEHLSMTSQHGRGLADPYQLYN